MDSTNASENRFALITYDNHSGYLWISSILCLVYTTLILIVRLHLKWKLYGADDLAATIATLFQVGEVIPLFLAMIHGLGKTESLLDDTRFASAGRATFAAQIFFILAVATAKGSVAALMLRLFTRDMEATRKTWILCHTTIVLTMCWCVGSIVAISISCQSSNYVRDTASQCSDQVKRWRFITAFDIAIEMLLMLLPIFFVWNIHMKRWIKWQVILAFGLRVPVMAFAAAHLHFVSDYASSGDVSKAIIPALVYQQFELFWALLAATIPTLKTFVRSFNSGFGMEIDLDGYGTRYGSGSNDRYKGSYPLESLQNTTSRNGAVNPGGKSRRRSEDEETSAGGSGRKPPHIKREMSIASDGSQELIIQRDIEWTVSYENARRP